jgi:NADH-quinone oxidoreductase subunit G
VLRKNGKLVEASWDEAFAAIAKVKPGAASPRSPATCSIARRCLRPRRCSGLRLHAARSRQTGMDYDTSNLAAVNFNSTFAGIEKPTRS